MKKIITFIGTTLLGISAVLFTGCKSTTPPAADAFKDQPAEQIFRGGEQALANNEYNKAIQHFEALDSLYPFNPYAEQAMLDSVYAYYENGDEASAVAAASRFLRLYPRSNHADYVYYMKGLSNYQQDRIWFLRYLPVDWSERDLGAAKQAFKDFSDLLHLYPTSPYAPDARQRMVQLRNILARAEINIARYYVQRHAYVAAANRANYVVQHYQGTPAVKQALQIMLESYTNLGLADRVEEVKQVLALNYPGTT